MTGGGASFSGLPANCPPTPHDMSALSKVFRVLVGQQPVADDWLSHTQLKKHCPATVNPCAHAGLSLFRNPKAARSFPNLRDRTHAAEMSFPSGVGTHTGNAGNGKNNHVTYWICDGHSYEDFVVSVTNIPL